jgi:ABC-2 type transport system permease protein
MIADKSVAILVHMVTASLLIGLLTWVGVAVVGLDMNAAYVWAATVHVIGVGIMVTGAAVLFAVALANRRMTMITVGGVVFVAYMVAVLLPVSQSLANWAKVSPWYYYWADNPLIAGVNWVHFGIMASFGIALVVLAILLFNRKDLDA